VERDPNNGESTIFILTSGDVGGWGGVGGGRRETDFARDHAFRLEAKWGELKTLGGGGKGRGEG